MPQRQPSSIWLIKIDIKPDQCFAELCLDGAIQCWLPYKMKILISQVKRRMVLFIALLQTCKSRRHIPDINLIYRPDFLFETITQLTALHIGKR